MGYRYPEERLTDRSILDPELLRKMLQPALEETAGRLNEHNVVAATFPSSRRSDAMLYDFHYAEVASDMGIAAADWIPVPTDPNAFRIPDSGEWVTVDPSDMVVQWSGGEDKAWIIGWLAYGLCPTGSITTFDVTSNSGTKPRMQFALRVNGAVLEETITGTDTPHEGSPFLAFPNEPITKNATDFVSTDTRTVLSTGVLSWHVRAVRMQAVTPVPQGNVTVEIVARRVAGMDVQSSLAEVEPVYVFNRKLVAVQMKQSPSGASTDISYPSVSFPVEGDNYLADYFASDGVDALASTLNDLKDANVQTFGLRREHLPGSNGGVSDADQTSLTAGTTTTRIYPGWGSDGTVGVGNWSEVNDGAGTNLRCTGPWNYSTTPAFVLILSNVAFRKASGSTVEPVRYGVFAIAGQDSLGTNFKKDSAEAHNNNPNVTAGSLYHFDCDTDVPLLEFYDYRTSPPANPVSFYRTLVAGDGNAAVTTEWQRSSMQVIHFHK